MATYIDLNSLFRDANFYTNPAEYVVNATQVATWHRSPRTVSAHSARPGSRAVEFTQSVQCKQLTLPYTDYKYISNGQEISDHTANLQRIYLDVHTEKHNDRHLVSTIDNKISKAKFVLTRENIQFDISMNPISINFGCRMDQVMRFPRYEAIRINIMQEEGKTIFITDNISRDPSGNIISLDKAKQTWILLEVVPYYRDGDYNNHAIGLTQY